MAHEKEHGHVHGPMEYRFCPRCGGQLGRRLMKSGEPQRLVCGGCSFIFYLDPKVVAGTLFTLDKRIVLLRRGVEPALGKWVFPGGYVDRGESVTDAAIRETREESCLDVRLGPVVGVYSYTGSPNVIVVYAADVIGGRLEAGDESVEAATFDAREVPWQDLGFDSTREALRDYIRVYLDAKIE
ncbi:MAG TPA: NUDIX hydrolase [Candidatus Binatia bacterium]|jgi:ADP-ribose pyrophosphatase YjhB (NUDIX family)